MFILKSSEQEILREEVDSLQTVRSRLQLRFKQIFSFPQKYKNFI